MSEQPTGQTGHTWVLQSSFGHDWWVCDCGAMTVDDEHPAKGGKIARSGRGHEGQSGTTWEPVRCTEPPCSEVDYGIDCAHDRPAQRLREQIAMTLAEDRDFAWVRLSVSHRRRWYEMADAVIPLVADHFVQAQRLADDTALDMEEDGSEFVRGWRSAQMYLRTQRLITEDVPEDDADV